MMKIYHKKSSTFEDETVLVQLDRRHTLKEAPNEGDSDDDRRKTLRAKSLGIFEEGHSSSDIEVVSEKKSGFTRKPTVITESELSSSRLYKDRKAKINSDDENIEDSSSTLPSENHECLEPRVLQDPNLQPIPVPVRRPRKVSSCCWYFTITLIICIACLAVVAGILGIVYIEYFSTFKDKLDTKETETVTRIDKSSSDVKEIFQNPQHKYGNMHPNEPIIPDHIIEELLKNSSIVVRNDVRQKRTEVDSQPMENSLRNKDLSNKILLNKNSNNLRTKLLNEIKNNFLSIRNAIEMTEHSKNAELSDISENIRGSINNSNVPDSDTSAEINPNAKNQDSLDLKHNNENIDIKDTISDEKIDHIYQKMTGLIAEKPNYETELSDSVKRTLGIARNFNFETTTLQGSELKIDRVNEDVPFQSDPKKSGIVQSGQLSPNSNSFDHAGNFFNNKEEIFFDNGKHSVDNSNSSVHVEDLVHHSVVDNSAGQAENLSHKINESLNNPNETSSDFDSDDSFSEEHLVADDHNQNSDNSFSEEQFVAGDHNQNSDGSFSEEHLVGDDHNQNSDDSFSEEQLVADDHNQNSDGNFSEEHLLGDDHNQNSDNSSSEEQLVVDDDNQKSDGSFPEEHLVGDDQNQNSDNSSSEEHLVADDQSSDESAQLVFIRPVVESKPVPVPLAFLRRIGFDIKNPSSREPMTAKDMDIKFSLSEALKFLKSLDTENKLPVSREKNITRKINNQKESNKTNLPILTEQKEYLTILRKKIFAQSL